jgi:formylglycine-generating enzyme required for sulfatase activity
MPVPRRFRLKLTLVLVPVLLAAVGAGLYFAIGPRKDVPDGRRGSGPGENGGGGATPDGKKYALLVGVKQYDHLKELKFTENDVTELAAVLRPAGFDVTLLCDGEGERDGSLAPTRDNVNRHLARVAGLCRKGDTLLLAFAGHGVQPDARGDSYFCPRDAKATDANTLVSLTRVYRALGESQAGARLLLVDACRDEGTRGGGGRDWQNVNPPAGVAALFSSSEGQFAHETDKLGKGHGVFTYFVLEGLRGKARNEDGEVNWDDLNSYVKKQVSRQVPLLMGKGAKQTPHALANLRGESPVLVRRPNGGRLGDSFTNSIGMKFVRVRAGSFRMGSPPGEPDRTDEEGQHEVEITKDFFLGVYEVTQKQYKTITGTNPSHFRSGGKGQDRVDGMNTDDFPVEQVSWDAAQDFLKKLNALTAEKRLGVVYRLPSEAEWEYACRGGPTSSSKPFHFDDPTDSLCSAQANFDGNYPYGLATNGVFLGRTCKVGSYRPNRLGIYDMHGNVREWCYDWYDWFSYTKSHRANPLGPDTGSQRVERGGSWFDVGRACRAAHRSSAPWGQGGYLLGFRVAAVPQE